MIVGENQKIVPMPGYLVVEVLKEEKTSGVMIDYGPEKTSTIGLVKALEKDSENKTTLKVGDKVVFGKHEGGEVQIGLESFKVLTFESIVGKLVTNKEN